MKRFIVLLLALLVLLASCAKPKPDYDELESRLYEREEEIHRLNNKIEDLHSLLRSVRDATTPLFSYFEDNSGSFSEAHAAYEKITQLLIDYN